MTNAQLWTLGLDIASIATSVLFLFFGGFVLFELITKKAKRMIRRKK